MTKKTFLLLLSITFLFSCSTGKNSISPNPSTNVSNDFTSTSYSDSKVFNKLAHNEKNNYATLFNNYGRPTLPSIGNQKILVVPISIKGYENNATEKIRNDLEKAFFGTSEETAYESVSSYYKKSSYNKLNLSGKVTDWFNLDLTPEELKTKEDKIFQDNGIYFLLDEIVSWYKDTYDDILDYDQNKDGFIDAIYLVYSAPNYSNNESIPEYFWAYTYDHEGNINKGDINSPIAMRYSWASYDMMYQGYGFDSIDAHTYIHETGHLLGLTDFYDTGYSNVAPMGKVDMMDDDLGDHSMYNKFALSWADPYIIDSSGEITLNSATETGDFLIFKTDNFNGTPFDEYIMMEYITPTGLNEKDYLEGHKKSENGEIKKGYQTSGLRITYINARAVNIDNEFEDDIDKMIGVKFSNTPRGNIEGFMTNEGQHLVISTLIPRDCRFGHNGLTGSSFHATSDDLFIKGDVFDLQRNSQYRDMTPHQTNEYFKESAGFFKYIVTIEDTTESTCKLKIETY